MEFRLITRGQPRARCHTGLVEARAPRRSVARDVLPAVAILLATWLLMWWAQGIPALCALANPCPAPDVRVAPALGFGGLMLVPVLVIVASSLLGRPRGEWLRIASSVVLVGLAVIGLGAVLFSGGFTVPFVF